MSRRPKILLGLALTLGVLALPQAATAFDAGVRTPVLADDSPGAVSVPFEIPIVQSAAVPQPLDFQIAVEGFTLDPDPVAGRLIGSLDLPTDSGPFSDKPIYSDGPGSGGVRTWTLDWQLGGKPIVATVEDAVGLSPEGIRTDDANWTLISFTVPGNYHGFRLMGLSLRFNQQDRGKPTPGIGAVNPPERGSYLIRSRIRSVAPESAVRVASATARIGLPDPKTKIVVGVNRFRVRPGGRARISVWTVNGTRDTVAIWQGGRRLRRMKVGPAASHFVWRAKPRFKGRRVRFRIKPANGPAKALVLRVRN